MERVNKSVIGVLCLIIVAFLLTGCVTDIDKRYNGLSIGFNFSGPYYSKIMYAVRSNDAEFNIDEVTLDFYCGWFGELPSTQPPYTLQGKNNIVGICFYIAQSATIEPQENYLSIENQQLITEIPIEEFWSESYLASQAKSKGKIFNHTGVNIEIPKEVFNQKEIGGEFELFAQIVSFSSDDALFHFDCGYFGWYTIKIRYNFVNENTVRLSK